MILTLNFDTKQAMSRRLKLKNDRSWVKTFSHLVTYPARRFEQAHNEFSKFFQKPVRSPNVFHKILTKFLRKIKISESRKSRRIEIRPNPCVRCIYKLYRPRWYHFDHPRYNSGDSRPKNARNLAIFLLK